MRRSPSNGARLLRALSKLAAVTSFGCALLASSSTARPDPFSWPIVQVEEDWELVVGKPDGHRTAPQITCAFSPSGDADALYAAFQLNHQTLPSFVAGGLQLQIWSGEFPLASHKFPNGAVLQTEGEVIRWTQSLRLNNGQLTFEITNGSSTTWGTFGGQGYLKATVNTTLTDLNGYTPNTSALSSGVGYGGNRVQSLVLKRVRWYSAAGDVFEDNTVRVVHPKD